MGRPFQNHRAPGINHRFRLNTIDPKLTFYHLDHIILAVGRFDHHVIVVSQTYLAQLCLLQLEVLRPDSDPLGGGSLVALLFCLKSNGHGCPILVVLVKEAGGEIREVNLVRDRLNDLLLGHLIQPGTLKATNA